MFRLTIESGNGVVEVDHLLQKQVTGWRLSSQGSFNVGTINPEALTITEQGRVGAENLGPEGRGMGRTT